jgi:hypothetical protein
MGLRVIFLITTLVLFWGISVVFADEPANISSFDPDLFQIPDMSGSVMENLSMVNLLSDETVKMVRGTGSHSMNISLTDSSGNKSVSYLFITGSDQTTWSYNTETINTSPYYMTAVYLTVSKADRVEAGAYGIANGSRDIAYSYTILTGDVSGDIYYGAAVPSDASIEWLPGPESVMMTIGVSGSGNAIDEGLHFNQPYHFDPVMIAALTGSVPSSVNETALIAKTGGEISNFTTEDESALSQIQALTDYTMQILTLGDSGYIGYRQGAVLSSADEMITGHSITNLKGCDGISSTQYHRKTGRKPVDVSSYIDGSGFSVVSYSGSIDDYGTKGWMDTRFTLDDDTYISLTSRINNGNGGTSDNILGYIGHTITDSPVVLSAEQSISWDELFSSISATYDGSAPYISHIGQNYNEKVITSSQLTAGSYDDLTPVSVKGHVQGFASDAGTGSASIQNLFYVDANRGIPIRWNSDAFRDNEEVNTAGTSTSGSQFIRQKAYSDRSTLTAT